MANQPLILGIDIGTTSVKLGLVEKSSGRVVYFYTRDSNADVKNTPDTQLFHEQDVYTICTTLALCMSEISKENLTSRVDSIAVTGQMHGLVLWVSKENGQKIDWNQEMNKADFKDVSNLVTWQDARCDEQFLSTLPIPESNIPISTGYGCATLFWLQRHKPSFLEQFNCAGTIQDFVVAKLCEIPFCVMSKQNAASWGYFDSTVGKWNMDILQNADFPINLLPDVCESEAIIGELSENWFGVKKGAKIGVANGDLQCSVFAACENENDAVINISTSAQLAFVLPKDFCPSNSLLYSSSSSILYVPYFDQRYLAVAASLNGGNVLQSFVTMIQKWFTELGFPLPEESTIWEKLLISSFNIPESSASLNIEATPFGERHLPHIRASVTNVHPLNTSLGAVFHALCRGLIRNIQSMIPDHLQFQQTERRLLATGSALIRNPILQRELAKQFSLISIMYKENAEAAVGAALAMKLTVKKLKKN